jgi:hypothetical protein
VTTTTDYGTWNSYDQSNLRVEDTIADYLGEFADNYDVPGLVAAYRAAINEALPEGITLAGDHFYGPYPRDFDVDLAESIDTIDLATLTEQHDLTAAY